VKTDGNFKIKILFIALAVILVAYFSFTGKHQKKYQWTEDYKTTSKQPYGTLFIQQLLENYRPGQKFTVNTDRRLQEVLDTSKIKTKTDYVFIGQELFLDDADRDALLNFISSGNDAFIASAHLPINIVEETFAYECGFEMKLIENNSLSVTLNFYNKSLRTENGYKYSYRYGKKDAPYFWNTLSPEIFCDSLKSAIPLGSINPDQVNFIKIAYGKGNLYLHTNPLVFTNYFMTKPDKAEYAASVFSHLHGKSVIWDEFSKSEFMANNAPEVSPVSYILQQDSLRYGWWLMLAAAILYALFTAKRKQRVIPVLEEKANTSLEFVNMVSALHFQNANHPDIARKKMKYFLHFIKAKYGIHTQSLTEPILKRLAEKSKVKLHDLESIAYEFNHLEDQSSNPERRLIYLHGALDKFYRTCK
jgi:hypothetical protein